MRRVLADRGGSRFLGDAFPRSAAGRDHDRVARQKPGGLQQLVALGQDPLRAGHVPAAAAGVVHAEGVLHVPAAALDRTTEQLSRVLDDLALAGPRLLPAAPAVPLVPDE